MGWISPGTADGDQSQREMLGAAEPRRETPHLTKTRVLAALLSPTPSPPRGHNGLIGFKAFRTLLGTEQV